MAIHAAGDRAHSFTGQQAGFFTDTRYGAAHIKAVKPDRVQNALSLGDVAIVAGFQASTPRETHHARPRRLRHVGRGACRGARRHICEIYTDVDGVFTADPRIVPKASRIPVIGYDEILEMSSCGSKVLALRCVEYAQRFNMPLHVRSSFSHRPGTLIVPDGVDPRSLPNID